MLDWTKLLSTQRLSFCVTENRYEWVKEPAEIHRSDYFRDSDRVQFASAFRRMNNKTQVFSMPENDHVHSRLTHSIEVASVGRSLGQTIGRILSDRSADIKKQFPEFSMHLGDIVHAACLAHDIGNPPFGHAGEDAISKYFSRFFDRESLIASDLTERQKSDFLKFDGNVQGFRLLTKLQNMKTGGLQLTAATLAAFCKYPRESGDDIKYYTFGNIATKKHGCFQDDKLALCMLAQEVGLPPKQLPEKMKANAVYDRHPLTFLVEAADNTSYTILDLEDGIRLNYVNNADAFELLIAVAKKDPHFNASRSRDITHVRGRAIQQLRKEICELFLSEPTFSQIMNGEYKNELIEKVESHTEIDKIIEHTKKHCYKHRFVIEMQVAGHNIISGLLDELIPAFLANSETRTERQQMIMKIADTEILDSETKYQRLLRATDYVAGMSDSFASSLYRRLKGIELSSSVR